MTLYLILLAALLVALLVAEAILVRRHAAAEAARTGAGTDGAEPLPVVFVHGILGFDSIGVGVVRQDYFRGVVRHLRNAGVPAHVVRVPPLGSVPERAAELARFVRSLPHERVTIVAHSMGGLDARYAITRLGLAARVAELVTVGTPHRGSPIADLADTPRARAVRRMANKLGIRSDAVDWLTTERLARFNDEVPDHPRVRYVSVVGRASPVRLWRNPILLATHLFVHRRDGANDGMVSVTSQRWGEEIEVDADHWAQIGWSVRFGAGRFYEDLVRRLRRPAFDAPVAPLQLPAPRRRSATET